MTFHKVNAVQNSMEFWTWVAIAYKLRYDDVYFSAHMHKVQSYNKSCYTFSYVYLSI